MKVYLSGEIHSNWREAIEKGCKEKGLKIEFLKPETVHEQSDDAGDNLGAEDKPFWKDHKSAKINSIRISNGIKSADLVVVKFGEKYRQWNAAFDAGYCAALGKPYIVLHPEEFNHALKEVNAAAKATAKNETQVVEILEYLHRP
ncbi:MAG: YtoQ family protein [Bacteroidia bacterium]|jgi:YtoQ family protein